MDVTSENFSLTEIKKRFGPAIVEFFDENYVVLERDIFGSYTLPENFIRDEWKLKLSSITKKKDKVNTNKKEVKLDLPEKHDEDGLDNFRLYTGCRSFKDYLTKKPQPDQTPGPSTSEEKVSVAQLPSEVARENKIDEIIKQNLNDSKCREFKTVMFYLKGDRVFENIVNSESPEYQSCMVRLTSIMDIFEKKHRHFQYNIFLDSFPQDQSLFEGQLSQKQIYDFFSKILHRVVPNQLFGNRKNNTKIKTTVRRYFESGSENFTLETLFKSMNIDSIMWLNKVSHKSNKMYLLSQVLNWFFDKFIWHIIYSYLYCEKPQPANYEKLIFRRWVKSKTIHEYMLHKVRENIYEPIPRTEVEKGDMSLVPKLRFYAKKSGLRPVLLRKTDKNRKRQSKLFLNILKRLYWSINPPKKQHITRRIWNEISQFRKANPDRPLYFVCCDIKDAFGSIIQNKLLEIVVGLMDNKLPETLIGKWIALLKPMKDAPTDFVEFECLGLDHFPPLLPSSSVYCPINAPNKPTTIINREWIKQFIKDEALDKIVSQ